MEIKTTKESEYILASMYKEFLDRYNQGVPRGKAKIFGHQDEIYKLVPEIWEEDLPELLSELKRNDLIISSNGSNLHYRVTLSDQGIIYMESKVGTDIKKLIKLISHLKSLFLI